MQRGGARYSRAYEEGAQQRNAKDLDVVLGDQGLFLILLSIRIRLVPTSITPSTSAALYLVAVCRAEVLCNHFGRQWHPLYAVAVAPSF